MVIAGSALAGTSLEEGVSAAIGIGVGSGIWFTAVAHLAHHGKKVLGRKVVWITRAVGAALIGYGLFCLGRAGHFLLSQM